MGAVAMIGLSQPPSRPRPPRSKLASPPAAPRHRAPPQATGRHNTRGGMAQRDKKEEPTELRAPEITLCANNCGFPGNPATQNLCQSCFSAASMTSPASPSPSSSSTVPALPPQPRPAPPVELPASPAAAAPAAPAPEAAKASVSRCSSCKKRVGLTGFRCRCGDLFCGAHRYSDRHGCSYDYKGAARDAIARENPVVRAAKIVRF